jgi:hypothetical protein
MDLPPSLQQSLSQGYLGADPLALPIHSFSYALSTF